MSYPKTGQEVYVSLNLSNTMLTGIGKGTITREEVSVDYLKRLFAEHGVIVSAKPEQHRLQQRQPSLPEQQRKRRILLRLLLRVHSTLIQIML